MFRNLFSLFKEYKQDIKQHFLNWNEKSKSTNNVFNALERTIRQVQEDNARLKAQSQQDKRQHQATLNILDAKLRALTSQNTSIQAQADALSTQNESLRTQLELEKVRFAGSLWDVKTKKRQLENEINLLEKAKQASTTELATMRALEETTRKEHKEYFDRLNTEKNELERRNESDIAHWSDEEKTLREAVEKLEEQWLTQKQTYANDMRQLGQKKADLQQEINSLNLRLDQHARLQKLERENKDLASNVNRLKAAQNPILKMELAKLKTHMTYLADLAEKDQTLTLFNALGLGDTDEESESE